MRRLALALVCLVVVLGIRPAPAQAFSPAGVVCGVANLASGLLGKACNLATHAGRIFSAGKQILSGHIGGAIKAVLGGSGGSLGTGARAALSLAAVGAWVLGGARFALHETAKVLSETTTPQLGTSWFSATYWRVAGIAALLTLPFLFAAAVQALIRSDLALLLRTVLGYLPLAMLAVGIAAPVTILLLSASDELSSLVSSAAGQPGSHALTLSGVIAGGVFGAFGSPFLIFFLGLLIVAGATALWIEMLMREAAVYVVVLMLPLAFSALVWPARRMWAIRAVELLIALILSKFAIVAVLSLGGAAMDQMTHSITAPIIGVVLVMMGAFAPWALLRLIPLSELGAGALESMRSHGRATSARTDRPFAQALSGEDWAAATTAEMRRGAEEANPAAKDGPPRLPDGAPVAEGDPGAGAADAAGDKGAAEPAEQPAGAPEPVGDSEPAGGSESVGDSAAVGGSEPVGDSEAVGGSAAAVAEQRLPGLPDMWQAGDLAWRPLVLGTEDGWPPRVWPPQDGDEPGSSTGGDEAVPDGVAGLPDPEAAPVLDAPRPAIDPRPAIEPPPAIDPPPAIEPPPAIDPPPAIIPPADQP